MPNTASVTVEGIAGIRACRFPFGRGVTPSVACVTCVPQNANPTSLTLTYNGVPLHFPDIALASSHVHRRRDGRHPLMRLFLKDRRWRWAGIRITGDWNRRFASGVVDPAVRKTPAELATLLLNRLGEFGFDVSQMPTGMYPRADWHATRADLALQKLCDDVACEVVLNPLTNRVEIWPSGTGARSATGAGEAVRKYESRLRSFIPSTVTLAGGESLYQYRLQLQAIGRQSNLQEKKLSDVDWAEDLESTEALTFPSLSSNELNQTLALATAWKQFRVSGVEGGGLQVPGCQTPIASTSQYDLKDYILYAVRDANGLLQKLPYYVEGDFWPYADTADNVSGQVFLGSSKLYAERGVVEFETPVFKLTSTGAKEVPELYLQTAYAVRDANGIPQRVSGSINVGGGGGDLLLHHPEIFASYAPTGNTESLAYAEGNAYLAAFARKYQDPIASQITYPGLAFGSLNGIIAQVAWDWSVVEAPSTIVYEGDEMDIEAPSSLARKRNLQVEAML